MLSKTNNTNERTCTIPLSEFEQLKQTVLQIQSEPAYALSQNSIERYGWRTSNNLLFLRKEEATEKLLKTIERQQAENYELKALLTKAQANLKDSDMVRLKEDVSAKVEMNPKPRKWWQLWND